MKFQLWLNHPFSCYRYTLGLFKHVGSLRLDVVKTEPGSGCILLLLVEQFSLSVK